MAMHSDYNERLGIWSSWYDSSFIKTLHNTNREMAARGIDPKKVEEELASKIKSADPDVRERSFRKRYQKTFTCELNNKLRYNPEGYMRNRLDKYDFNIFPRLASQEAMDTLETLGTQAAPRVSAAVLNA